MKILLASSEVHPYSKSGGLADMVAALAKSFAQAGHEAVLVTPLYGGILDKHPEIHRFDYYLQVRLGSALIEANVFTAQPRPGLTLYFIDQPRFFNRLGLYGEQGRDYSDNATRFIFFSKCVVHLARYLSWRPDVVHVHDWQTALVPILLLHQKLADGWAAPRTCLTVHNIAYQGHFSAETYALTNLPPDYYNPRGLEFYGGLNNLKAGLVFADMITTVSPRYAREITTPEFGFNLDPILRQRQDVLVGILNGVDYEEWNTEHNPYLAQPYSVSHMEGKGANKSALQEELGLPPRPDVPLFGSITRLAHQKGIDLLLGALEESMAGDVQLAALGSGDLRYEEAFRTLARRYPKKVALRLGFNQGLSHRIEAGSDFFLMPSLFEPCGLNQMYSLRYGTIPIVRATGGLDDTVVDASEDAALADGIKFSEPSVRALVHAVRKARVLYNAPPALGHYRHNAMEADFSWERTTQKYIELFAGT
jgi:starch synthase